MSTRPDFEESRQHFPAEACTEKGFENEPGCGPNGTGLGPMAWLLVAVLALVLVLGTVHLTAGGA